MVLRGIALSIALLVSSQAFAAETYTLKFATLLPTGTAWSNILTDWVKEVEQKSQGQLKFKMYSGGVMGDEPDVIRKIRKGQLHGGMFTGYGIGRIYSPARVLEVPFLFKDTGESDYVRDALMPDFETGFKENGFELLGWPEVGFIHFFSQNKIESLEDMRKSRIWLWQGDPLGEAFFKASNISPVPLSIIDVFPQLSAKHGSIDTVYVSTFGAIALQWHTNLKYGSNIPVTNAIGGLVVSNVFFDKLPEDLQQLLKTTGKAMSDKIRKNARFENERSKNLLKRYGISFLWDWNDKEMQEFLTIRDNAAEQLEKTNYIPAVFFNKARDYLKKYHDTQATKK
ncbi:MAG: TRAP transporter substrate-binding protein DctP [Gammaproteobacteria bacterium]|nr:TRAP transporter substrate-binding protein DctP [Gammaproteobacteria bacterium]